MMLNDFNSVFKAATEGPELAKEPPFVEEMGEYNDMPIPFEEIDLEEALHKIIETEFAVTFRQIRKDQLPRGSGKTLRDVRIFWSPLCAIALAGNHKENIKAYRIGCKHEDTEETRLGQHRHEVVCKDCGLEYEYDSS